MYNMRVVVDHLAHCVSGEWFHLEEVFSAVGVFNEALHQLHEVCLWGLNYRIIGLGLKKTNKKNTLSLSNSLFVEQILPINVPDS